MMKTKVLLYKMGMTARDSVAMFRDEHVCVLCMRCVAIDDGTKDLRNCWFGQ